MGMPEKILWGQLSPEEQKLYVRFEQAFSSCASTVDGSGLDRKVDVWKVLLAALGDHPEVVYFDRTQLRLVQPALRKKVIRLEGAMSAAQSRARIQTLQRAAEKAEEEIARLNPISDYDKLICIYEYIQDHVVYDSQEQEYNLRHNATRFPDRHNAYGALVEGQAVCDGFSGAFALLAQRFGFSCATVNGEGISQSGERYLHAWNIAAAEGGCYHLDVTWDQQRKNGGYSYEYFCLDDSEASLEHIWEANAAPVCAGRALSFYFRNRCQANSLSQLDDIFLRYVKSKASVIRVKLAGGVAVPEPADYTVAQRLLAAAASVGRSIRMEYHWNRALQCFYGKIL